MNKLLVVGMVILLIIEAKFVFRFLDMFYKNSTEIIGLPDTEDDYYNWLEHGYIEEYENGY